MVLPTTHTVMGMTRTLQALVMTIIVLVVGKTHFLFFNFLERIHCLHSHQTLSFQVRHEAAEALGSIATDEIYEELGKYLAKSNPEVVRESCVVALDFVDYNTSDQFQYADSLNKA